MLEYSSQNNDKNGFNQFIREYKPEIDLSIREFFNNKRENVEYHFSAELYSFLESFCLREGKRIRPMLLLISYIGYKEGGKNLKEIIKLASVLEIMHSFLLIQDDIIDRSPIRRGEKTLHVLCRERYAGLTKNMNIGNDVALVLGDILFSNAIEIIGNVKISLRIKNEFLKLFAKTYEVTSLGQILDSINSLPTSMDIGTNPMQISVLKTAYYTILSPLFMGFKLAGRREKEEENRIKDFSIPLGMAFQIRDDILGVFGDKDKTGKSSDSDIIEGKFTLLIQNTVENLKSDEREEFTHRFTSDNKTEGDIKVIKNLIEKSNALEISNRRLKDLIDSSKSNLRKLKIKKEERRLLSGLIDSIAQV